MALVGYARVSSTGQSLDIQLEQLKKAGCTKIFKEKVSGATRERPELERLLEFVREGDTVIVSKLDRLARSMRDFCNIVDDLQMGSVGIKILAVEGLDTSNPTGRMILGVLASIAEFERELIKERQAEGIAKAQAAGRYKGRVPLGGEVAGQVKTLAKQGVPKMQIAKQLNISRGSVYKYLSV